MTTPYNIAAVPYVDIAGENASIKEELLEAIARVIGHSQFIPGPEVAEFEARFADLCGVRFAVGVNSGTDALELALRALEIGPGDEVITAPNSFVSPTGCIVHVGARPVFVDVGDDYNINAELIERAITPPDQGYPADPPDGPAGRHGRDPRGRRRSWAVCGRGRGSGGDGGVPRQARGITVLE